MNTARITALYPYFLDCLRHLGLGQHLEDALIKQLQTEALPAARRYSIALTDVDNPGQPVNWLAEVAGVTIQEFATARLFDWVRQQLPALAPHYQAKPATGWHVYLQASNRGEAAAEATLHLYANGSAEELATVLRGLRAYQAKRRKLGRRLVRQLLAYHWQQQTQTAAPIETANSLPAGGLLQSSSAVATPPVSCHDLPSEEYFRRLDAAEDREEQLQQQHHNRARYGREIMWHHAFAAHCVLVVSELSLVEVTTWLAQLAQWANQGRALDRYDYAYLADLMREGLADNPTPLAALRLARTLAAVERVGATLLPHAAQPLTTTDQAQASEPTDYTNLAVAA